MIKSKKISPKRVPAGTPAGKAQAEPRVRKPADRLPICIEVTDKGTGCAACHYMHATVVQAIPRLDPGIEYRRVDIRTPEGKARFLELSVTLHGKDGVHRHHRLAPLPALFINGKLAFRQIPTEAELVAAVRRLG